MDNLHHFTVAHRQPPGRTDGLADHLHGDAAGLYGDCTHMTGDVSGITGNCTRIFGDVSGIFGDLDCIPTEQRVGFNLAYVCATKAEVDG